MTRPRIGEAHRSAKRLAGEIGSGGPGGGNGRPVSASACASMRRRMNDQTLYAFQMAALLEAKHRTNEAIGEYVKALDEDCEDYGRARRRPFAR